MGALRVAHIIPNGEVGGAQEYLASLAAEQSVLGLVPFVLTADRGPFVGRYRDAAPVIVVPALNAKIAPLQNLQGIATLRRVVADLKVDLVHGHTSRGMLHAALLRCLTGIPSIASAHGFNSAHALMTPVGARLATWAKRAAIARLDAITVAAEAIREIVVHLGVPREKVHVVYAGIDSNRFYPRRVQRTGPPFVGAAGRFLPIKGFRFYVEAACRLLDQGVEAEFCLFGDGPDGSALTSLVSASGHQARFRFFPFRQDFDEILRGWDIAVVPSIVDSFPFIPLEAMATGIPVVATAVGGIPEALHDGREGFLVPPARSDLLASAIHRLLVDPGMRSRMGSAGLTAIRERFTWRRAALDYCHLYERVLGRACVAT